MKRKNKKIKSNIKKKRNSFQEYLKSTNDLMLNLIDKHTEKLKNNSIEIEQILEEFLKRNTEKEKINKKDIDFIINEMNRINNKLEDR